MAVGEDLIVLTEKKKKKRIDGYAYCILTDFASYFAVEENV